MVKLYRVVRTCNLRGHDYTTEILRTLNRQEAVETLHEARADDKERNGEDQSPHEPFHAKTRLFSSTYTGEECDKWARISQLVIDEINRRD